MDYYAIGWLIAIVVFVLAEALSPALISIWFAAGAVGGLICSFFSDVFWLQLLVFFILSGILLAATRPLCQKYKTRVQPTNADMLIGQSAVVTTALDPVRGTGRVTVSGQSWAARPQAGQPMPEGQSVTVQSIQGATLIVTPDTQP